MRKAIAAFAMFVAIVAGTVAITSTAEAVTPTSTSITAPPAPTKQDKPTKPTKGAKAKKGMPGAVPPTPCPPPTNVCMLYAGDRWADSGGVNSKDGAFTNMSIINPTLKSGTGADYHSLVELAVQSYDGQQIIEVGYNKDPTVNGDSGTHVFVYHWVNHTESCYNACGWVDYAPETTWYAGKDVTSLYGAYRKWIVQYSGGNWWIATDLSTGGDLHWMGYFPANLWTSPTFTKTGFVQRFGEIAASNYPTCTDMGYGVLPDASNGASLGSLTTLVGSTWTLTAHTGTFQDTANGYGEYDASSYTIKYGGGGSPQAVGC